MLQYIGKHDYVKRFIRDIFFCISRNESNCRMGKHFIRWFYVLRIYIYTEYDCLATLRDIIRQCSITAANIQYSRIFLDSINKKS